MKDIGEFISYLYKLGIKFWAEDDRLHYKIPKAKESMRQVLRAQLAERKSEILTFLKANRVERLETLLPIKQVPRDKELPLSFAQQRLWFLAQLEDKNVPYNEFGALNLTGPLNAAVLEQSLTEILQRHEVLRTTFNTKNGIPYQVIASAQTMTIPIVDLRSLPPGKELSSEVRRLTLEESRQPFDLIHGPLLRVTLLRLPGIKSSRDSWEPNHILLLTMHHIISDMWSMGIFLRELSMFYEAFSQGKPSPLPALPIQYADYAVWQRNWLQGEVLELQLAYWLEKLAGAPGLLELPTDHPRPAIMRYQGKRLQSTLDPGLTRGIKQLSRQHGVTVFMTLLAAFKVLLYRYSGQTDLVVGSPIANRTHHQTEDLIGFFVNTLVFRTQINGEQTFSQLLEQVRQTALEAYSHQDIPFEYLVEQINPSRSLSHSPLFQVMFVLQNAPGESLELSGIKMSFLKPDHTTAKFDLTLSAAEQGEVFVCDWEYCRDLFRPGTVTRMAEHFQVLLEGIVNNPEQALSQLPLLTEDEKQQLLDWNQTKTDYPKDLTIVDLFQAQVDKTPGNIALDFGGQQLSYQELDKKTNQLAHYLMTLGVKPETLVGICIQRSIEMVIGFLGILKAGGAYLPLDPDYPTSRLQFILEDSSVPVLLSTAAHSLLEKTDISNRDGTVAVCLDEWETLSVGSIENPAIQIGPEDLVYVIYTSGSTGKPKGVNVTHRAVVRLVKNTDYVDVDVDDCFVQASNMLFDAATFEIWGSLLNGARLVGISRDVFFSPHRLARHLRTHRINTLFLTTALFNQIAQTQPHCFGTLKTLLFGGEQVEPNWVTTILATSPPKRLLHMYGPTESTTYASWYLVEAGSVNAHMYTIPIGKPIANTRIYILDTKHNPTPSGISGELCIAGAGLARGYLNRPELTAEKFCLRRPGGRFLKKLPPWTPRKNFSLEGTRGLAPLLKKAPGKRIIKETVPLSSKLYPRPYTLGPRLYKTGDLARWLPDGNLEFLGRLDHQVKLRGFRIELGEIETVLSRHEAVKEAVVVLNKKEDNPCLVAYVTLAMPLDDAAGILRSWLKARLPGYMVPSSFMVLEKLPLTPNGKIDRKALPEPGLEAFTGTYQAPRTDREQCLVETWNQVLKQNNIGIFDNFFERGGDSILSIQIVARARAKGLELNPRDLFQHQTIAQLAQVVQPLAAKKLAEQGPVTGDVPPTPIQQAFFVRQPKEPWHFNQAILLAVPADINEVALRQALAMILQHHDALRLRYRQVDGQWQQWYDVVSTGELPFHIEDLRNLSGEPQVQALQERADFWQASLNLETGPLVRLVLFHLGKESRLLWCIHHLVVDGVSWRILLEDLQTAYHQAAAGRPLRLPAKTSSFKAWAEHLFQWKGSESFAAQAEYWRKLPQTTPLPIDNPGGRSRIVDSQHYTIRLTTDATRRLLTEVPAAYHTRINDLLLTALMVTLREWTGESHHLIDLESHGRGDSFEAIDLSRTVGWFTSLHTLSLHLPTESDLGAALKSIKEQLRNVPHEGVGYGVLRYFCRESLPQGQILFNYLGQLDQIIREESEFRFAAEGSGRASGLLGEREHLIEINGQTINGCLSLTWSYSSEQYQGQTMQKLADRFQYQLEQLIEHCSTSHGYTPSDFPLATTLGQTQLDQLAQIYGNNIADIYPLSPMQQGMLFHSLYAPGSGIYFEQLHFGISGALDIDSFQQAWQHVIDRHGILRTGFWHETDTPLQVVCKTADLPWQTLDWHELPGIERQQRLQSLLSTERSRGFELHQAPLMRVQVIRETDYNWRLVWNHHHVLMDGWCLPILFTELFDAYSAFAAGQIPRLPAVQPYRAYITWLSGQDRELAQSYWQEQLEGFSAPTPLPMASYPGSEAHYRELALSLEVQLGEGLNRFSRQQRLTLNTVVQGAWAALLSRYSGENDVVFGVTTSGRQVPVAGIDRMVGLFINTLPLRVQLESNDIVSGLQIIQKRQQQNDQYAYTALADIQNWSEVPNGISLFDTIVVFENYPVDEELRDKEHTGLLRLTDLQAVEYTNYPITLAVIPGRELHFKLTYDDNRFQEESIERMLAHFVRLLEGMAAQPGQSWHRLPLLTEADRRQLLAWNQTESEYPKDQTIVDLFQSQVEKTPGHIAVVFEDQQLGYRELNKKANQLGHYLMTLGVGAESLVGICAERSLEMVVGLLGILKAGGAYVPLDPGYPLSRLRLVQEDSELKVLLSQSHLPGRPPTSTAKAVCLDSQWEPVAACSGENPARQSRPENLAYVIYTSGSTGKPKGVLGTHQGMVNRLNWMWQACPFETEEVCCHRSSINFVDHIAELFSPLCKGVSVVLLSEEKMRDTVGIINIVHHYRMVRLLTVPSLLRSLLEQGDHELQGLASVKYWFCSGEALPARLVKLFYQRLPERYLFNIYGSSEVSADVSAYQVERQDIVNLLNDFNSDFVLEDQLTTTASYIKKEKPLDKREFSRLASSHPKHAEQDALIDKYTIPIGKPISNTQIYIFAPYQKSVPIGVSGELHAGGAGLARGYLNRPELTAEKFIEIEVFGKSQRLYKTGDLARWLPTGNLEYLGRLDHQVKLRGFRIELGEIETALSRHEAVKEAVVVLYNKDGNPGLAAYVTLTMPVDEAPGILRSWLKGRLPEYMLPAGFMVLDKLPLTPNGKIDREALSEPELVIHAEQQAPRSETERLLCNLWSQVLGIEVTSIFSHFFAAGGHSLLATQLVSRIRENFGIEMPLRVVFERALLREQAEWLDKQQRGSELPPIRPLAEGEPLVLSFAQQRLWFLAQLEGQNAAYNMPAALRLEGQLDETALQRALTALIQRHHSLRLCFPMVNGKAGVQLNDVYNPLTVTDLTELSKTEQQHQVVRWIANHAQTPFDLGTGPLLNVRLLKLGKPGARADMQEQVLLFNMHHIISDGWSMGVLIREWSQLYSAYAQNRMPRLPKPAIQYTDYAAWQRNWLQGEVLDRQLAYWLEKLTGAPQLLELPTDYPRPAVLSYQGKHLQSTLDPELTRGIKQLSRQHGVTVFMTLLAAYKVLLFRYSGQTDLVVGSPIANRTHHQTEDLIGLFVNTLALRTQIKEEQTFPGLLKQVRQTALEAYSHQDIPFEYLIEQLNPSRSLSHSPLFQVMFALQNAPEQALELGGLKMSFLEPQHTTAKFDLDLGAAEQDDIFICDWEYCTDLFRPGTVTRMSEHFQVLLEGILDNPEQFLSQLPLLTEADRRQLLAWNQTKTDYPKDLTMVDLFQAQVEKTPDHIAVVFEEQALSYQALNTKANRLAHYLMTLGVGADTLVGICVERSLETVIGLLGILKAGGVYVPLDPDYPLSRLWFILGDSGLEVLLSQGHLLEKLPASTAKKVCLDSQREPIAGCSGENPLRQSGPGDLAYMIYTSGSTGLPKGVTVEHLSLFNHIQWVQDTFTLSAQDKIFQVTTFSFDVTIFEFHSVLLIGGTLLMAKPGGHQEPGYLPQTIHQHRVTIMQLVPSLLKVLLESPAFQTKIPLRFIFCGGESLSSELKQNFYQHHQQTRLYNLYGPTEATIDTTYWLCDKKDSSIAIGRPIANTRIYILDTYHNPTPPGIPGELCIAGAGLARGYLNRPELTAEKFDHDLWDYRDYQDEKRNYQLPKTGVTSNEKLLRGVQGGGFLEKSPPGRRRQNLYKTGDLARWLPDGNLEFSGRLDQQVKLRGFRIELSEIEVTLSQHQAVKEGVVVLYENENNPFLAAYVTLAMPIHDAAGVLRSWLKTRLPEYMVPASFTVLEQLPLTPNGKIDRKALPIPKTHGANQHYQAPRDSVELQLTQIWENVLEVSPIGIGDNFFELGGQSLLAVRLMSQIGRQLGKHLPLAVLFQNASIEQLAAILRRQSGDFPWSSLVAIQAHGEKPPLFCVHPSGGNVLCYVELARHLGKEQPFYGLQAFGLEAGQTPYAQVEEMAAFYLKAIKTLQAKGPYQLAGWSFGGVAAFEMARQLQTQGEYVSLLALLDAAVPSILEAHQEPEDDAQLLVNLFAEEEISLSLEHLRQLIPDEQLTYVIQQGKQVNLFPPDVDPAQAQRLLYLYKTNVEAAQCYQPHSYGGKIILFQAAERPDDLSLEPDLGWGDYAAEGVEIIHVPGNHQNMVKSPHVRILAEKLKIYLN